MLLMTLLSFSPAMSATSSTASLKSVSWRQEMMSTPTPSAGCFQSNYPSLVWETVQCGPPVNGTGNVGNTNDYIAEVTSGHYISQALGEVSSMSGFVDEKDNGAGTGVNYYSIQDNSQFFITTFSGHSVQAWEQFFFQNQPGSSQGVLWIEYWLFNWYSTYGSCPTNWFISAGDCVWNSPTTVTSQQNPSTLASIQVAGDANLLGTGVDESAMCNTTSCYVHSQSASILNLYEHWIYSEWNVLGYINLSDAGFNHATSMTIEQVLYDSSFNNLTPSCGGPTGYTGETNNLTLGAACYTQTSTSPYYMYFSQS
jgi:hypothetical protein